MEDAALLGEFEIKLIQSMTDKEITTKAGWLAEKERYEKRIAKELARPHVDRRADLIGHWRYYVEICERTAFFAVEENEFENVKTKLEAL